MDRRSFVRVAGITTLAIATADCEGTPGLDSQSLAKPELLGTLGNTTVRAIGTQYRAMTPSERDVATLRQAINGSRPLTARLLGSARPGIHELVREDFDHGRTVVVDGWLLSVTEARQCALYSLLSA